MAFGYAFISFLEEATEGLSIGSTSCLHLNLAWQTDLLINLSGSEDWYQSFFVATYGRHNLDSGPRSLLTIVILQRSSAVQRRFDIN